MPIAIDSSSPAVVSGATPRTTASFTAPADSLLVALVSSNSGTVTHTVTTSGLTWTSRVKRDIGDSGANASAVEIFTALALTSAARTVQLSSSSGGDYVALKVFVVTGADLDNPVGAVGEGSSSTANLTVNAYTSTAPRSRAVGIAADEEGDGSVTSSDVGFGWSSLFSAAGIAVYKASDTANAGTTVTLNFNGSGGSRGWNWAAMEILAAPILPRPSVLRPTGAVHRAANW